MLKSKFPSPLSTVDISFFEIIYIFSYQDIL
ncbi:TPA: hypothetical protein ACYYSM_001843 [Staphylococcus aureus]|uniref:Uncharacterized protein n=2 Tax=Staphylococcus aureus TaxID=1280 RepID=Q2FWF2_STAA8|nr:MULTISPECIES: hypothetical protein [Staphylococcus]YP_500818.1 hypothetical protein SAOUHSC_02339 [Staphylococcus aureus subsp. aureus NCTC 8325]KAB0732829.1 hypothetical protein F7O94_32845 [Pseudomonas aeruginosa]MRF35851.1 hypothetical protein [Staphylococcus sp. KY49P]HAR4208935.1 hypothetical protein [Staphylococcus aureus ADL-210]HAR4216777.1 hypothetical protein [Staphylococcus aureus ADL-227]HAR4230583.1 hypothetical protein [Staphylococcus aureus ADL-331]HAR4232888.1 hypothetical